MTKDQANNGSGSWLESLKNIISRKPKDRQDLIDILRNSENRNLLDPDVLLMIEGALHVSDMRVNDIMIPRIQMVVIQNNANPEEIIFAEGPLMEILLEPLNWDMLPMNGMDWLDS